jgi:hypothetical protein
MSTWHYAVGERSTGPVEEKTLRALIDAGSINGDTLVWREGMTSWAPARTVPEVAALFPTGLTPPRSPHAVPPHAPGAVGGDATGGLIPYRNPKALIAYYLGICALIPCIGSLFGIASTILGVIGLRDRARNPLIKGAAHAWVGIVLGVLSVLGHLAAVVIVMVVGTGG